MKQREGEGAYGREKSTKNDSKDQETFLELSIWLHFPRLHDIFKVVLVISFQGPSNVCDHPTKENT